ncbi:Nuf2-domain-containing protein [Saitoella complicata NRRL Y-17804]|uniref:Uncharacterized protein n=1 Tax=Saitoella complicata (strain BCRC 22490 / CBS 7301 / JCM 7358 / NBRC 10748 / NRRL Y-17804) TaxID=698492 RepID=A0A0E9NAI0_SAICN|nr:Nuf2-domain-containing protein [Saitoella complicata NRRL Y-17804]ODQ53938.1 Nuf2-domain-containing protein [Saitoella complicata NRRL Y-17804]GAO46849.1 hypothetical protein G7K_1067-t1 [Saitoella complicata NRRL Y-17804]
MSSYLFPDLSAAEILTCMSELSIPFTEDDLNKPSPQRMQMVYETFADILMGVTRENLDSSLQSSSDMDFFEIHSGSLGLMVFHQKLVRLMNEVGIQNFSVRDLIKPEPGSVRRILSAILNFAKFREEQMPVLDAFTAKSDEVMQRHEQLTFQAQEMKTRLEALKKQRDEEEPLVQKAREANIALTNDLKELKKQETALTKDNDILRREKAELTEKMTNLSHLVVNTQQECEKIRARIVHDPETLKETIASMGNTLNASKANVAAMERKARELQARMDAIGCVEEDVATCLRIMEECETELTRLEEASRKVSKQREIHDQKQIEVREVEAREHQLLRQFENASDKLVRATHQAETKREAAQKRMAQIREEYALMTAERGARQQELDKKRAMTEQIEQKIADLRADVEAEVQGLQVAYSKLMSHVDLYMEEMVQCMDLVETA